jgi:hypothetical protein
MTWVLLVPQYSTVKLCCVSLSSRVWGGLGTPRVVDATEIKSPTCLSVLGEPQTHLLNYLLDLNRPDTASHALNASQTGLSLHGRGHLFSLSLGRYGSVCGAYSDLRTLGACLIGQCLRSTVLLLILSPEGASVAYSYFTDL